VLYDVIGDAVMTSLILEN